MPGPDTTFPASGFAGLGLRVRSITTTATLSVNDDAVLLCDATGGAFTVTLPAAADAERLNFGMLYCVKKTDVSANAVTLDGAGAETIDGAANVSLAAQFDTALLISDGTEWHLMAAGV